MTEEFAINILEQYREKPTLINEIETVEEAVWLDEALDMAIQALKQEPKMGHCKDCKYFEYDSIAKVDGIPLIVAHEICNKWGNGCKTKEDGYCFLFEPQERSNKE